MRAKRRLVQLLRERSFWITAPHLGDRASMINSYHLGYIVMTSAVKKTISLPDDLARETEALARAEGKTLSAVVQDAFAERIERQLRELRGMQGYWSRKARDQGFLPRRTSSATCTSECRLRHEHSRLG